MCSPVLQGKVRVGPKAKPSLEVLAAIQQQWVDIVEPVCNASTYAEMRAQVNAEMRTLAAATVGRE